MMSSEVERTRRTRSKGVLPGVYPGYIALSLILLVVGTSITIVQYKVPSILEPLMEAYAMGPSSASWLMSVFTMVGIFLSLPTGALAKRLGPKRVLLVGCAVIIVGSAIGAFTTTALPLIISRAIEGVAFVFITVAAPLFIEKYVTSPHQGTANGIWSLWICLGSVIGSTITPWVFEQLGMSGTWLAYGAIVALAALVLAIFVKVPRRPQIVPKQEEADDAAQAESNGEEACVASTTEGDKVELKDYLALMKPSTVLFLFAYLMFNTEILAILSYTPTFLQNQGMDASLSGFASSLPGLLAIVSCLAYGRLIDRAKRAKPFYCIAMLSTVPATFLMLTQAGPLLWVGAFLLGIVGYGVPVACLTALPQIAGSDKLMPAAMGLVMLVQCLGEFLGSLITPMLLGPAMDQWLFCGFVMSILGAVGFLSILLCRFK